MLDKVHPTQQVLSISAYDIKFMNFIQIRHKTENVAGYFALDAS